MRVAASGQEYMAGNGLLALLPAEASRAIAPHLEAVHVQQQDSLYNQGDPAWHAYFPVGCVVAGVTIMNDGTTVETAMFGREGMVGVESLFGSRRSNWWGRAILPGEALRIRLTALEELTRQEGFLRGLCFRYYCTVIEQVSRRVVCNTSHNLFERLCTWLLMLRDRAGGDELTLTQETVSRQLGVRRAGINEAAGRLQRMGLIDHSRGRVRIANRASLEGAACICYGHMKRDMSWHGGRGDGFKEFTPEAHAY